LLPVPPARLRLRPPRPPRLRRLEPPPEPFPLFPEASPDPFFFGWLRSGCSASGSSEAIAEARSTDSIRTMRRSPTQSAAPVTLMM
jgi:hypothetical protein